MRPTRRSVRECLVRGLSPPAKDNEWHCSSPADGTQEKICPRCWPVGLPIWLLRFRCVIEGLRGPRNFMKMVRAKIGAAWSGEIVVTLEMSRP